VKLSEVTVEMELVNISEVWKGCSQWMIRVIISISKTKDPHLFNRKSLLNRAFSIEDHIFSFI
jgi:hypothetical protein